MFGFGDKKLTDRATQYAKDIKLFHMIVNKSKGPAEALERALITGAKKSYLDEKAGSSGWFSKYDDCFSYHAVYGMFGDGTKVLSAEAHRDIFGIAINAQSDQRTIYVEMKEITQKPGKNAKHMQQELLKFDGFSSLSLMLNKFL